MGFGIRIKSQGSEFTSFQIMIFTLEDGGEIREMVMECFLRLIRKYSKVIGLMTRRKVLEAICFINRKRF
jgi:hypothetical protein